MDILIAKAKQDSTRFFTSGVSIGIKDTNTFFNSDYDSSFKNPQVRLVVDKLSTKYANLTLNTRKNDILNLVTSNQEQGLGVSDLVGSLKSYFDELSGANGWQAWRIARTEAGNAWDSGAFLNYQELGFATFDVVGCEDSITDCNRTDIKLEEVDGLEFHPNHTGCLVPSEI